MSLLVTLLILGLALASFAFANWKSRRPPPLGEVRLVPYNGLQFIALVVAVLMLAHLVSLLTGTPLEGRMSR